MLEGQAVLSASLVTWSCTEAMTKKQCESIGDETDAPQATKYTSLIVFFRLNVFFRLKCVFFA